MDYNINDKDVNISNKEDYLNKREDYVSNREDYFNNRLDQVSKREDYNNNGEDHVSNREDYNNNGEDHVSNREDYFNNREDHVSNTEDYFNNREDLISNIKDYFNNREKHVSNKEDHVNNKEDHINNKEDHINNKEDYVNNKENYVSNKEDHVSNKENHVSNKEDHINNRGYYINNRDDRINNMSTIFEENKKTWKMPWMEGVHTKEMEAKKPWIQPVNQYDYIATSNMISFMREGAGAVILSNPENSNTKISIEKTIYHNFSDAILSLEVFHNVEIPEDATTSEHYAPKDLSNYPQEPFCKLLSHENLAYHKDYCFLSSTINPYQSVDEPMLKGMELTPGTNLAYIFHIVNQQPQTVISVTFHWTELT